MKLLLKLLRQNMNLWHFACFALANVVGAFVVLCGMQAYQDMNRVFKQEDGFMASNYIVLTKSVNLLTTLTTAFGADAGFSKSEIEELKEQQGVTNVGEFNAAAFSVRGVINLQGAGLSSEMFLESVPDEFIDLPKRGVDWKADFDGRFVPVIIPQTYLNLYNYGFASSQGLPQVGEGVISSFPLMLEMSGRGQSRMYEARIVAFTNRLNTILVPDGFLKKANERMGSGTKNSASRLIVSTTTEDVSTSLLDYIKRNKYVIEGNAADSLRMQTLTHGIVFAVIGIGVLVILLSFFLLMMSIMLLIEKNREKFKNLYSLGYSVKSMARPYQLLALGLDLFTFVTAAALATAIYPQFRSLLTASIPDFQPVSSLLIWVVAAVIAVGFIGLHFVAIRAALKTK